VLKSVILIIVGLASTVVLALASYHSKSGVVRVLFWTALFAAAAVIVYSGIEGIRSSRDLQVLRQKITGYEPFRISERDKVALYGTAKELVILEKKSGGEPPRLHFLTFPGQSADAAEFQETVKHAFEQAGKKTIDHHNLAITGTKLDGEPWDGVIIQVNDLQHPPVLAERLFTFFLQAGIKVWSKEGSGYGANDVVIWSHRPNYVKKE
jgi:hypothetical protein